MRVLATARVKVVAPNSSRHYKLIEFLKAYRDWTQYVVDEIWRLDHIPSMKELHLRFYRVLRSQGSVLIIVIRLRGGLGKPLKQ